MLDDLSAAQRELAEYMSELSELGWNAGWMHDLEYELWRALEVGPVPYGRAMLTASHLQRLRELSARCSGWIRFDAVEEETFVPIGDWQEHVRQRGTLPS